MQLLTAIQMHVLINYVADSMVNTCIISLLYTYLKLTIAFYHNVIT